MQLADIPRHPLTFGPSPIHPLPRLSEALGGEVEIPRGRYAFADLQLVYSMPSGARLRTDVDFRAGTFFDGQRVQAMHLDVLV